MLILAIHSHNSTNIRQSPPTACSTAASERTIVQQLLTAPYLGTQHNLVMSRQPVCRVVRYTSLQRSCSLVLLQVHALFHVRVKLQHEAATPYKCCHYSGPHTMRKTKGSVLHSWRARPCSYRDISSRKHTSDRTQHLYIHKGLGQKRCSKLPLHIGATVDETALVTRAYAPAAQPRPRPQTTPASFPGQTMYPAFATQPSNSNTCSQPSGSAQPSQQACHGAGHSLTFILERMRFPCGVPLRVGR